jgi:chemotaxis protein MotB
MSPGKGENVVIIKKGHGKHHGHHGGAWKVAYADFVTAMMAFFLVMWIVGQSKETRAGIASYFRDPVALAQTTGGGNGVLPGAKRGTTGEQQEAAPNVEAATKALENAAHHLKEKLSALPQFDKIKDRVNITVSAEGLEIDLLDDQKDGFFDTGSATLKPETVALLQVIGHDLGDVGHPVVVDGHTDKAQYARPDGYTNWELSADRANAARRVLQTSGIKPEQIEAVRGYADTKLKYPDRPLDPGNRRISILVRR